jgi:NAD(P)H dehydrogenase (quinone)
MKVFIVFAHPEPQSLNGSLLRTTVEELEAQGHEVKVSDLYAMQWKAQVDRADFPHVAPDARFKVTYASAEATMADTLTEDVKLEQEKLLWADTIIFQFPLWWYAMPAILKGWVERVLSLGFGYGIGEYSDSHWGDRYGEGKLLGKRAMLSVTVGSWREHFSARGVNGPLDDLLFPVTHGVLFYTGLDVLPSFVVYQSDRLSDAGFTKAADELRERLRTLSDTKPIAFRPQNGGDYEIPTLMLKPGLEGASVTGFSIHVAKEAADSQE